MDVAPARTMSGGATAWRWTPHRGAPLHEGVAGGAIKHRPGNPGCTGGPIR